ncbi:MAG: phage DNA packaging protein J [Kiloniellales bacterium]
MPSIGCWIGRSAPLRGTRMKRRGAS